MARHSMTAFATSVVQKTLLNKNLMRVTLHGERLKNMATAADGYTWDMRIKIVLLQLHKQALSSSEIVEFASTLPNWYQQWLALDPYIRGNMRTYTVSSFRPHQGQIDVDIVLHPQAEGPGSSWARHCKIGDEIVIFAPHAHAGITPRIEFEPHKNQTSVLIGDETALSAIGAILRDLGPHGNATAIIEVSSENFITSLGDDYDVHWCIRNGKNFGSQAMNVLKSLQHYNNQHNSAENSTSLHKTDNSIKKQTHDKTSSDIPRDVSETIDLSSHYFWVAGETSMVHRLRRYLLKDLCLTKENTAFMGYWKAGAQGSGAHDNERS